MKRIPLVLVALLFVGAAARAEDPPPRRARDRFDYSGRVQLHPPPSISDPRKPAPAPDLPGVAPADTSPNLPARPTAIAPAIPLPFEDAPDQPRSAIPRPREVFEREDRKNDPQAGASGWGWLADEIATNRARRSARNTDSESRAESDSESNEVRDREPNADVRAGGETNRDVNARAERRTGANQEERLVDQRPTALDPVIGWGLDSRDENRARMEPAPELDFRLDPTVDAALAVRADWSRLESPIAAPVSALGRAAPEPVEEAARPTAGPARWMAGAELWGADRDKSSAPAQLGGALMGGASAWQPLGFSPSAIAPQEPLSIAPTPLSPSLNLASPAADARSLGGMGSERERAAPKTLPW